MTTFEHAPIDAPGLYEIRVYDPNEVHYAEQDGIPLEAVAPRDTFQALVTEVELGNDRALIYTPWPGPADYHFACSLWKNEWITQRRLEAQIERAE